MHFTRQGRIHLLLAALLGGAFWLLSGGIAGAFLFDDYNNLAGLAAINDAPGLTSILTYIFNGQFNSIGRPLSLATFAAQHAAWPDAPGAFKTVNILIHLFNGLLLFMVFASLARLRDGPDASLWVALFATALWLLHPLQISTVLYVVQRMTELAALFMLLGLLLYLRGREAGMAEQRGHALWLMSLGICTGLGLGVLSKENAALMPLLVLVTEFTLLARVRRPHGWSSWSALFLVLPTLLLAGYLAVKIPGFAHQYALREFTLVERLLTEARVLFDYLGKLLLPTPNAFGLLFDDFTLSRGLLDPPGTLFAVAGIAGLAGAAFVIRHRQPVLAFAILWFLGAHLLESSVIPLELYYEHRNYLPLTGPALALAHYALRLLRQLRDSPLKPVVATFGCAWLALVLFFTYQEARLWGNPLLQAVAWHQAHPDSRRLAYLHAGEMFKRGHVDQAAAIYQDAAQRWSDSAVPMIAGLEVHCFRAGEAPPPLDETLRRLAEQRSERNELVLFLSRLVTVHAEGACPTLQTEEIFAMLNTAAENPYLAGQRGLIQFMKAQLYAANGDLAAATVAMESSYRLRPRLETALEVALLYARQRQPERARQFLLAAQEHPRLDRRQKGALQARAETLLRELERQAP